MLLPILSLLLLACGALLVLPEGKMLIDRGWQGLRQADRHVRAWLGLPLRGTPDLAAFDRRLAERGLALGAPVFIRIFKKESELELWLQKDDRFALFATYPICRWSGQLGPKLQEGDRQAPEGFYTVAEPQLNPNSKWHRSFNLGFPNAFDLAHGRTGSFLMVHGGCGSIGCYAMTNPAIDEIWTVVTAALRQGQPRFHVHVFPYRMTPWNQAVHRASPWQPFWSDLKKGNDLFETARVPPRISVCDGRYVAAETLPGDTGSAIEPGCPSSLAREGGKSRGG